MDITVEWLAARLEDLERQKKHFQDQLIAVDGAMQDCRFIMQEALKVVPKKVEAVPTLAQVLNEAVEDYKASTSYAGIDAERSEASIQKAVDSEPGHEPYFLGDPDKIVPDNIPF